MQNQTFHIITLGCQMNRADSERVASYLTKLGYLEIDEPKQAKIVVFTTCGVRQGAENRVYGLVPRLKEANPGCIIVITGCLASRPDVQKRLKDLVDIWLPIFELPNLQKMLADKKVGAKLDPNDYLEIKPNYKSSFSVFVPIGNGCNNFCSYCVVPYARGRETYRDASKIIKEVKTLIKAGYKEITLIAQNVNSYKSGDVNFANLLKQVNDLPGDFWLRFSTSHPKDMSDELIETLGRCEKLCPHIHLPAQAGDNEILRRMNRNYTIEHYKELIKKIRLVLPGVAITTDVIIGFPGETKTQFNQTKKLFKDVKYDMAYVSQYSPRYGTVSYKMEDDVTPEEKKRRDLELNIALSHSALVNNKKYNKQEIDVLVEGKTRAGLWYGKSKTFKLVKFPSIEKNLVGKIVKVKITIIRDFGLDGELIEIY